MNELVDTSTWRYAVISVRSEPGRERLVIAYPDEETLRNLVAAPSIVALGYTSRAGALKNIDRCVTSQPSLKRLVAATQCCLAFRRLAGSFGLLRTSRIMRTLLHNGVAVVVIFFYSRNVLSSTVRAFISF